MSSLTYSKSCDALAEYLRELLFFLKGDRERVVQALIEKYGSLDRIAEASVDELASVCESQSAAMVLRLCVDLTARRVTDRIKVGHKYSDEDIEEYVRWQLFGLPDETVYLLAFDGAGKFIASEYAGIGTVNASAVVPRKLVNIALSKGAKSVILAHNHPDGFAKPSGADEETTRALSLVFSNVGIKLCRHYIVAGDGIYDIMSELK
jgi:DNA repair protein RadC